MALVTVAGTAKAMDVGAAALVAIAMGAVTGTVLGACAYVGAIWLGLDRSAALVAGFLVTFIVRDLAIKFGWSLPVFRESATHERWSSERRD